MAVTKAAIVRKIAFINFNSFHFILFCFVLLETICCNAIASIGVILL